MSPPRLSPRQKAFKIHLFPNQNTVRARLGTIRARLGTPRARPGTPRARLGYTLNGLQRKFSVKFIEEIPNKFVPPNL